MTKVKSKIEDSKIPLDKLLLSYLNNYFALIRRNKRATKYSY